MSINEFLFGFFWFLPLCILLLETKFGKRKMVDERDRFSDEFFSYTCAVIGVAVFLALAFRGRF